MSPTLLIQKLPHNRAAAFFLGAVLGGCLVMPSASVYAESDDSENSLTSILYALAELAVDSETNAEKIVALEDRVNDLEQSLLEMTTVDEAK